MHLYCISPRCESCRSWDRSQRVWTLVRHPDAWRRHPRPGTPSMVLTTECRRRASRSAAHPDAPDPHSGPNRNQNRSHVLPAALNLLNQPSAHGPRLPRESSSSRSVSGTRAAEPCTRAARHRCRVLFICTQPATDIESYLWPSKTGRVTAQSLPRSDRPYPQPGLTVTVQSENERSRTLPTPVGTKA